LPSDKEFSLGFWSGRKSDITSINVLAEPLNETRQPIETIKGFSQPSNPPILPSFPLWLLLLLCLTFSGCRQAGRDLSDIGVNLTLNPNPPQVGQVMVSLTLSETDGQPISGAKVELEGNMTHAGMAPVISQAQEVGPGQYEAPLDFNMAGDWFILVRAVLPDGRKLERQVDVPGVK
jgi:hypothetical protein